MKRIAVIGSLNYDMFLRLAYIPKIGETANALSCKTCAGGKGANQAVQLAKLGITTYMIGCVGEDYMGNMLLDSLRAAHVNTEYVQCISEESTGMGIVDVFSDGRVMAVINHGANYRITMEDILLADSVLQQCDLWVLQLEIPVEIVINTVKYAKRIGKKILLNAAPATEIPEMIFKQCDYIVVNEIEASFYVGKEIKDTETARLEMSKLVANYGNCWICTLGEKGAIISKTDQTAYVPPIKTNVTETTGAGDSFVGGFCYGILKGMDAFASGIFASYCSAITIQKIGAQEAMPTKEELFRQFCILE